MIAPKPIPLAEKEWKFDSVPPDELEACFFYEYGREYFKQSRTLQKLRARWEAYEAWRKAHTHPLRAQWSAYQAWQFEHNRPPNSKRPPMPPTPMPKRPPMPPLPLPKYLPTPKKHEIGLVANDYAQDILSGRHRFAAPIDFRTFPAVSWQDLPTRPEFESYPFEFGIRQAEERQRKRKHGSDRFHIETEAQFAPAAEIRGLQGWIEYHHWFRRDQDFSNTEYGFFAINWDYPPSEIRRAFREWLKQRERERKGKPKANPSPSRGQWRDKLHWLGALRVRNHYRYRDLVDSSDGGLKMPAPYNYYPALRNAAKKAEHLISETFPSENEAEQITSTPLEQLR